MADKTQPSAPPAVEDSSYVRHTQVVSAVPLQSPSPMPPPAYSSSGTQQNTPSQQPPPPYEEAMNYPAVPTYPSYQPNVFPKPAANPVTPQVYPQYQATAISAPLPNALPNATVTVHSTHIIHPSGNCVHCLSGNIQKETDACCLICLLLLAVFTFPVGLVFLCCLPCTVRNRCTRCRRLG